MPRDDKLRMWTVYDHPRDFPHCYVARMFTVGPHGATKVTSEIVTSVSLDALRAVLMRNKGMSARIERDPSDDPKILETWL